MSRVGRNTIFSLIAEAVVRVLSLGLIIFATRTFGAAQFGNLAFAQAVAGYVLLLAELGFVTISVRDMATARSDQFGELASIAQAVRGIWGVLVTAISAVVVLFLMPGWAELEAILLLLLVTVPLSALSPHWLLMVRGNFGKVALVKVLQPVISITVLCILFWTTGITLVSYVGALVVGQLGMYGASVFLTRGDRRSVPLPRILKDGAPFFVAAAVLGLSSILGRIYYDFDLIMLRLMKTDEIAGSYASAYKLINLIIAVPLLISQVMLPVLARSGKRLEETVSHFLALMFTIAWPILVGGWLVGPRLLSFAFGNEYVLGAQVLPWMLLAATFIFLKIPGTNALVTLGHQKYLGALAGVGAVLNLGLNLLLIPSYHLFGAAAATICTEFVLISLTYLRLRKIALVPSLSGFKLPFLACAAMLVVLVLIPQLPVLTELIIGGTTYSLAYLAVAKVYPEWFKPMQLLLLRETE